MQDIAIRNAVQPVRFRKTTVESNRSCIISMEFGFVGTLMVSDKSMNVAGSKSWISEFALDPNTSVSDQVFAELAAMTAEAHMYHNKFNPMSATFGHVLSHSVAFFRD